MTKLFNIFKKKKGEPNFEKSLDKIDKNTKKVNCKANMARIAISPKNRRPPSKIRSVSTQSCEILGSEEAKAELVRFADEIETTDNIINNDDSIFATAKDSEVSTENKIDNKEQIKDENKPEQIDENKSDNKDENKPEINDENKEAKSEENKADKVENINEETEKTKSVSTNSDDKSEPEKKQEQILDKIGSVADAKRKIEQMAALDQKTESTTVHKRAMIRSKSYVPKSENEHPIVQESTADKLPKSRFSPKTDNKKFGENKRVVSMGNYSYINYKSNSPDEKKELYEKFRKLSIDKSQLNPQDPSPDESISVDEKEGDTKIKEKSPIPETVEKCIDSCAKS